MTPTTELREELRAWVSERIPINGTDADTHFTDAQLDAWLLVPSGTLEEAAWRGWLIKAGEDRGGVLERSIGPERLKFASPIELRASALKMAELYQGMMPKDVLEGSQAAELDPPDVLGTEQTGDWDMSRILGYQ